ncbi:MAG: ABC transporter permease subunit [Verrucomicrobia bacterium]|jgi:ABC-type glycerol-3-phosphate transport system permease component|nr:ABC transporter permease subunit [Verrucomicrobiota bacterium]
MPIISQIGRKALKTRALIGTIYGVLLLGSLTMVYPFMLMVAGSTKSPVDTPDARVIPPFLVNETELYRKYVESLFNEELGAMCQVYESRTPTFRDLPCPSSPNRKLVAEWAAFLNEVTLPKSSFFTADTYSKTGALPLQLRRFKAELGKASGSSLDQFNRDMHTEFTSWNRIYVRANSYLQRSQRFLTTPFQKRFSEFKQGTRQQDRYYVSVEGFFKREYLRTQYSDDIERYNQVHSTAYEGYGRIHLDRICPDAPGRTQEERDDWETFVRTVLNLLWVRVDDHATVPYQHFLKAKYGTLDALNQSHDVSLDSLNEVRLPQKSPESGLAASDWEAFLQGWHDPVTGTAHRMPVESLSIYSVEFTFRDYLAKKWGDISKLNEGCGTTYTSFSAVLPPQQDWHYLDFLTRRGKLRWEFATRNLVTVSEYVLLHGRAIYNTTVYCLLAIVCALVFNPVAAYALSRYKPRSTYKILLFLMMVMAFPPMVTQIPVFLMLRELHLLNTFWALVLPGVANGYSIFLLKGFFDSLPKELYESAELDGAGEIRIFWQFTMALSKPILAVIALQAFNVAYGNFMMALLICQDEKMWTLMPWIYQLQMHSGEGIIYASILIAAIPTFILFVFCQNIIMRGIVVPTEK